jgi:hypothetical protein
MKTPSTAKEEEEEEEPIMKPFWFWGLFFSQV